MITMVRLTFVLLAVIHAMMPAVTAGADEETLRVGVFDVDASPPVGSPLAYDPTKGIETPLSCRGVVLLGAGKPIVFCAVDWIGIANGGQTLFRESLARAARTDPGRVSVHTLHQHDAPRCDFAADSLLDELGVSNSGFDVRWAREVIRKAGLAVEAAVAEAQPVTHLGLGKGIVHEVASNRRILGPDGKVLHTRYTATKNPKVRDYPVGTIDPEVKLVSFWNGDRPLVALTYYATHPQSYYRTGLANPDFPGLAWNARQEETGVPHIHFNGAGGNIGAGKWNDGAHENRQRLADRVAAGMRAAWESTKREPLSATEVSWTSRGVKLPPAAHLREETLAKTVADPAKAPAERFSAAQDLVWLRRCQREEAIELGCLALGGARVLHMPGELFVEYQLAAQGMRPDLYVAMAAYGEYAPGYVCTKAAYGEGGYEPSERASNVSPEVEEVLMEGMRKLLK